MTDREILEKILVRLDSIENDISDIKHVQEDMQSDISSIKMTLENDVDVNINLLLDKTKECRERITNLDKKVQDANDNIAIHEVMHDIERIKPNIKMN